MNACPKCGGTSGIKWTEHQVEHQYLADWAGGAASVDCTLTTYTRPRSQYAKCMDCNKRVLIEDAIK
jgi:hypothetical protein